MDLNHSSRRFILTIASVALAAFMSTAHADDYADVARLTKAKQFSEALAKADQYLASKPRDPQMRFMKGVVQNEMGKVGEATTTFTRLTEEFPEIPEPYNNLAVIYANSGQFDKARAALEMALKTNPSYSTAHENLGDIYAKLASKSYAKALQIDVASATAPSKLQLIREIFPTTGTDPKQSTSTQASHPVVAPLQPKQPTVIVAAPTPNNQPQVAPPAVAGALSNRDVTSAVTAWAQAWSDRNMSAYLASYTKDFTPSSKQSHEVWEKERRLRIMGKAHISVKLSSINVVMGANGTSATVKFRQDYKADALATSSRKTLEMVKSGERWLISKEMAG